MINVILSGCCGYMGRVLTEMIAAEPDMQVTAGIDLLQRDDLGYPVYTDPAACDAAADVMIDFSNFRAVDGLLDYCVSRGLPIVLCTTGLSETQLEKVAEDSQKIAILRSANMSVGINLLMKLLKEAAAKLAPAGFDMEIVEKHHNRKIDAPSGTAIALGECMNEALDGAYHFVYDRSERHEKRDGKEIGISAVRGGTIVGEHEIIFAGQDEVITFKHTAYSRALFAKGAVQAAKFLAGKPAGLYDMSQVV